MLTAFLDSLEMIPFLGALRTAQVPYALLSTAHILCLGSLLGTILSFDLGIWHVPGFRWAQTVARPLRNVAICAFVGAALTGFLLFAVQPREYVDNAAFQTKLLLIGVAGINAVNFAFVRSDAARRICALLSIVFWLGVVTAGRFIAFM
jgi:hypothetical protein